MNQDLLIALVTVFKYYCGSFRFHVWAKRVRNTNRSLRHETFESRVVFSVDGIDDSLGLLPAEVTNVSNTYQSQIDSYGPISPIVDQGIVVPPAYALNSFKVANTNDTTNFVAPNQNSTQYNPPQYNDTQYGDIEHSPVQYNRAEYGPTEYNQADYGVSGFNFNYIDSIRYEPVHVQPAWDGSGYSQSVYDTIENRSPEYDSVAISKEPAPPRSDLPGNAPLGNAPPGSYLAASSVSSATEQDWLTFDNTGRPAFHLIDMGIVLAVDSEVTTSQRAILLDQFGPESDQNTSGNTNDTLPFDVNVVVDGEQFDVFVSIDSSESLDEESITGNETFTYFVHYQLSTEGRLVPLAIQGNYSRELTIETSGTDSNSLPSNIGNNPSPTNSSAEVAPSLEHVTASSSNYSYLLTESLGLAWTLTTISSAFTSSSRLTSSSTESFTRSLDNSPTTAPTNDSGTESGSRIDDEPTTTGSLTGTSTLEATWISSESLNYVFDVLIDDYTSYAFTSRDESTLISTRDATGSYSTSKNNSFAITGTISESDTETITSIETVSIAYQASDWVIAGSSSDSTTATSDFINTYSGTYTSIIQGVPVTGSVSGESSSSSTLQSATTSSLKPFETDGTSNAGDSNDTETEYRWTLDSYSEIGTSRDIDSQTSEISTTINVGNLSGPVSESSTSSSESRSQWDLTFSNSLFEMNSEVSTDADSLYDFNKNLTGTVTENGLSGSQWDIETNHRDSSISTTVTSSINAEGSGKPDSTTTLVGDLSGSSTSRTDTGRELTGVVTRGALTGTSSQSSRELNQSAVSYSASLLLGEFKYDHYDSTASGDNSSSKRDSLAGVFTTSVPGIDQEITGTQTENRSDFIQSTWTISTGLDESGELGNPTGSFLFTERESYDATRSASGGYVRINGDTQFSGTANVSILESLNTNTSLGSELVSSDNETDWGPANGTTHTAIGSSYSANFSGTGVVDSNRFSNASSNSDPASSTSGSPHWTGTASESGSITDRFDLSTNGVTILPSNLDSPSSTPAPEDASNGPQDKSSDSGFDWEFTGTKSDSQQVRFESSRSVSAPYRSGNLSGSASQLVTSLFTSNASNTSELQDLTWNQTQGQRVNESSVEYSSNVNALGPIVDGNLTGQQSMAASSSGRSTESITSLFVPGEAETSSQSKWETDGTRADENSSVSDFDLQLTGTEAMSAGPAGVLASVSISVNARTSENSLKESKLSETSDATTDLTAAISSGTWVIDVDSSHDLSINTTTFSASGSGAYSRNDQDGIVFGSGTVSNRVTQSLRNESNRNFDPVSQSTTLDKSASSSRLISIDQSSSGTGSYTNALGGGSLSGIILESTSMIFEIASNEASTSHSVNSAPSTPTRTGSLSVSMLIDQSYSRAGVGSFAGGGLTGTISENGSFDNNASFHLSSSIGGNQNWKIDSASKSDSQSNSTSTIRTTTQNWSGPSGEFHSYSGSEVTRATNGKSSLNASQQSLQSGGSWAGTTTNTLETVAEHELQRTGSGDYRSVRAGIPVTGAGSSQYRITSLDNRSSTQVRDLSGGLISDNGSGINSRVETSQWNVSGGGSFEHSENRSINLPGAPGTNSSSFFNSTSTVGASLTEARSGSESVSDVTLLTSRNGVLSPISRNLNQSSSFNVSGFSSTSQVSSSDFGSSFRNDDSRYESTGRSRYSDVRSGSTAYQGTSSQSLVMDYLTGVNQSGQVASSTLVASSSSLIRSESASRDESANRYVYGYGGAGGYRWVTTVNTSENNSLRDATDQNQTTTTYNGLSGYGFSGLSSGRLVETSEYLYENRANGVVTPVASSNIRMVTAYALSPDGLIDQRDRNGTYGPYSGSPIATGAPDPRRSAPSAIEFDETNPNQSYGLGQQLEGRVLDQIMAEYGYSPRSTQTLDSILRDIAPAITAAIQQATGNPTPQDFQEQANQIDLEEFIANRFTPSSLNQTIYRYGPQNGPVVSQPIFRGENDGAIQQVANKPRTWAGYISDVRDGALRIFGGRAGDTTDSIVNGAIGVGDNLTMNAPKLIRQYIGNDIFVDTNGKAYKNGEWIGFVVGFVPGGVLKNGAKVVIVNNVVGKGVNEVTEVIVKQVDEIAENAAKIVAPSSGVPFGVGAGRNTSPAFAAGSRGISAPVGAAGNAELGGVIRGIVGKNISAAEKAKLLAEGASKVAGVTFKRLADIPGVEAVFKGAPRAIDGKSPILVVLKDGRIFRGFDDALIPDPSGATSGLRILLTKLQELK